MRCSSCVEDLGAGASLQFHLVEGGDESALILVTGRIRRCEGRVGLR